MDLLDLMVKVGVEDKASNKVDDISEGIKGKLATAAKVGVTALAAITTATVAVAKGFWDAAESVSTFGDNIDKTSQKLGVSYEAFQKWDYVMNISGTSMNNMSMGLKTLTNKLDDAKNGSSDAQAMFEKLGISMEDLNNMSREEAFEAAIHGFQGMADSTERAALANDLFGRSGQELTPLFNMTVEETNELMAATERLGFVMSDDAVKASAKFVDAQTTLNKTLEGVKNRMMSDFLPSLATVMNGLAEIFAGNVHKGTSIIHDGIIEAIDIFNKSLPRFIDAATKVVGGILTAILNNFPLIIRAFLQGIADMIRGLSDNTDAMLDTAVEFIGSILTALVDMAPEILAALLDLVVSLIGSVITHAPEMMAAGMQLIGSLISAIGSSIGSIVSKMWELLQSGVDAVWDFIGDMFDAGANLIRGLIDGISSAIGGVVSTIMGGLSGAIDKVKSFLGIASPSKLFRNFGQMTMLGMAEGIADNAKMAEEAMLSAAKDVYDAASGTVNMGISALPMGSGSPAFAASGSGDIYNITINAKIDSETTWEGFLDKIERAKRASGR